MDRRYINEIISAYISDYQLTNDDYQYLVREVNSHIEEIRLLNEEVYEYLHSLDRYKQQRILCTLMDSIRGCSCDDIKNITEDIALASIAWTSLKAILGIGLFLVLAIPSTRIRRILNTIVGGIGTVAKSAYKIIERALGVKQARVMDAILYNRLVTCSKKCGISNLSDLGSFAPSAFVGGSFASVETRKKVSCLINCYLWFHINVIALLAQQYKSCVKKASGTDIKIDNITALRSHPLDIECKAYYDTLKKYVKQFEEAIDEIYQDLDQDKAKWIRRLNSKLSQASPIKQLSDERQIKKGDIENIPILANQ